MIERVARTASERAKRGSDARQPRREQALLWGILGVSLVVQLLLAPYRGFFNDMQIYLRWAAAFNTNPLTIYSSSQVAYPPLTIYLYAALELAYHGMGRLLGFSDARLVVDGLQRFSALWLVAKLPTIGANLGSAWLLYRLTRPVTSARWALLATASYALAPSLLLDGALWGQTDGIPVVLILLAIVAIQRERSGWAGAALGAAVMMKPQPIIFLPLLLLYLLRVAGWRAAARASLALVSVVVALCLPYLLPPRFELLTLYHNATMVQGYVSSNAFNLWFMVNPLLLPGTPVIGPLTAAPVGALLFTPVYALALALVWRGRSLAALAMALALAATGFFELTAMQHERYLFQALAFLLLAAAYSRAFTFAYAVASLTTFLNMLAAVAAVGSLPLHEPALAPLDTFFWRPPFVIFATLVAQLALFAAVFALCLRQARSGERGYSSGLWGMGRP